jgi:hypothetical protein
MEHPGKGVFVPSAPKAGEDDGYVMAFVHNPDRGAADLGILAAQGLHRQPGRPHPPPRPDPARLPRQLDTRPGFRGAGGATIALLESGLGLETHAVGGADPTKEETYANHRCSPPAAEGHIPPR